MKQCLNFRVRIPNPITLGVVYDNQACASSKKHRVGDTIQVWNADRSGRVEAEVYNISFTSRDDFRWKLVGEE